jgi:hypothetical protein
MKISPHPKIEPGLTLMSGRRDVAIFQDFSSIISLQGFRDPFALVQLGYISAKGMIPFLRAIPTRQVGIIPEADHDHRASNKVSGREVSQSPIPQCMRPSGLQLLRLGSGGECGRQSVNSSDV